MNLWSAYEKGLIKSGVKIKYINENKNAVWEVTIDTFHLNGENISISGFWVVVEGSSKGSGGKGNFATCNKEGKEEIIILNEERNKSMGNELVDFFRNLGKSKEEKLLKELGIEDPIGTPTKLGYDLILDILYKENREKVIKLANELQKEREEQEKKK